MIDSGNPDTLHPSLYPDAVSALPQADAAFSLQGRLT